MKLRSYLSLLSLCYLFCFGLLTSCANTDTETTEFTGIERPVESDYQGGDYVQFVNNNTTKLANYDYHAAVREGKAATVLQLGIKSNTATEYINFQLPVAPNIWEAVERNEIVTLNENFLSISDLSNIINSPHSYELKVQNKFILPMDGMAMINETGSPLLRLQLNQTNGNGGNLTLGLPIDWRFYDMIEVGDDLFQESAKLNLLGGIRLNQPDNYNLVVQGKEVLAVPYSLSYRGSSNDLIGSHSLVANTNDPDVSNRVRSGQLMPMLKIALRHENATNWTMWDLPIALDIWDNVPMQPDVNLYDIPQISRLGSLESLRNEGFIAEVYHKSLVSVDVEGLQNSEKKNGHAVLNLRLTNGRANIEFALPTDRRYYNSLKEGDNLFWEGLDYANTGLPIECWNCDGYEMIIEKKNIVSGNRI